MKKNNKNNKTQDKIDKNNFKYKIIKNGKEIEKNNLEKNRNETRKKTIFMYIIPLIIVAAVGVAYIPTQKNILLIPFGIAFLICLFGWDGATRTCSNCGKWNTLVEVETKTTEEMIEEKVKPMFGKTKTKKRKVKHTVTKYKCKNCGQIVEKTR